MAKHTRDPRQLLLVPDDVEPVPILPRKTRCFVCGGRHPVYGILAHDLASSPLFAGVTPPLADTQEPQEGLHTVDTAEDTSAAGEPPEEPPTPDLQAPISRVTWVYPPSCTLSPW